MRTTIRNGAIATLIAGIAVGAIAVAPTAAADPTANPYLQDLSFSPPPIDTKVDDAGPRSVIVGPRVSDRVGPSKGGVVLPTPAPSPFLFTYPFDHKLQVAGGDYTVDHAVIVRVRYDSGETKWSKRVIARPHPITPGGAVYVSTGLPWCTGNQNGYAQAYDESTKRWSPRVRVDICDGIDGTGDFNNHPASD